MVLDVRLLGPFSVSVDDVPITDARWSRRQATLLIKLLALAPRQRLPQAEVLAALWPGADTDAANNGLHKIVHLARHALEPELTSGNASRFLVRIDGQLCLTAPDALRIDVIEFEQLATRAIRDRDEAACLAALDLYGGDLLPADRYAEWAASRREQLRGQRLQMLLLLAASLADRGELADAITRLQQLLALDGAHEAAHRQLMTCFLRAGARTQALRQFQHCRATLRRELDTEPEAATLALHRRIVAGQDAPPAASPPRPPAPGSLAVLPFSNLTGDSEQEYLASGIAESLIRMLSRQPQLRVMAPSTVLRYRHREVEPRRIGLELGVATLLLGRLERFDERFVLCVELVRVLDGSLLWGERFEREHGELVAVEAAIAEATSRQLAAVAGADAATGNAANLVAYGHYLRGRHEWNKRTGSALQTAIQHFERAIDADPGYALAYSGLADCHSLAGLYTSVHPHESMRRARRAAERAIELEPLLAEAHTSLAFVQFAYDWDFPAAERAFARAIALSPSYATAYHWQHELLTAQGRFDEQRIAIEKARALDPLSPIIATEVGWGLYFARRFEAARLHLERTIGTTPDFPIAWLVAGLIQLQEEDPDTACASLRHGLQLAEPTPFPLMLGALGHAEARAGNIGRSERLLQRLLELSTKTPAADHAMAMIHTGRNEHDLAIACLRTAHAGKADRIAFLRVDPLFDELRRSASFQQLVEQMPPLFRP